MANLSYGLCTHRLLLSQMNSTSKFKLQVSRQLHLRLKPPTAAKQLKQTCTVSTVFYNLTILHQFLFTI